jgi:uncharacterized repeat protein (TIGR01451 family)
MKYRSARPSPLKYPRAFLLLFALVIALVAVPIYSVRARLIGLGGNSSVSTSKDRARSFDSRISSLASLTRVQPSMVSESIATYSADCTTPQTTFFLGQTVCAITNDVDAAALTATPGRWVDWILTGATNTIVSGSRTTTKITTNPQSFTYLPTATGTYKVEITQDNPPGTDDPQTPAVFTVVSAPLATYAANCTTLKNTFTLGEGVCVKADASVSAGDAVAFADPAVLVESSSATTGGVQTFTFTLPTATTQTRTEYDPDLTFDNRGTWQALLKAADGAVEFSAPFIVRDPSVTVADLQISKSAVETSLVSAGDNVKELVWVFNYGPDAAASVKMDDATPSNTTFVSVTQTYGPSFTCTTPAAGDSGISTCTRASLARGEAAGFEFVYQVGSSIANGTNITGSATVSTTTTERTTADNNSTATDTGGNPTPPACSLTCPGNMTVTADTTGPGFDSNGDPATVPGANVSFSATTSGTCNNVTASPASGSFFPLGTTPVTITSDDGASCDFLITVVSSGSAVTISCPANVTANAGPNCNATVSLGTPTTTGDNVTVTGTRSDGQPLSSPFPVGVTTVHWVASNSSGSDSCDQQVTVLDVTPPTITAVSSTVSADANCQALVPDYHNLATDNCACASDDNSEICQSRDDIIVTQSIAAGTSVGLGAHSITLTATDEAGNSSTKVITFTVVDTTAPVINCPANVTVYLPLNSTAVSMPVTYPAATGTDNCDTSLTFNYSQASGSVFPVGTTTVTVTATDDANNSSTCTFTVTVLYDFTGFFAPVNNLPTLNVVNAGRAIPVKFSLSGDKGLSIFAVNSPQVGVIPCDASAPATDLNDTVTAGSSSLSYDAASDTYNYVWKTDSSWAGTCRQLVVTLNDGSVHVANFKFK